MSQPCAPPPPRCEISVTRRRSGLRTAPREQLTADRTVREVVRMDVHVEPARRPADRSDKGAAQGRAVARAARITGVGMSQRDHDRPVHIRTTPVDVSRDRILDVPDSEPITELTAVDNGAEATATIAITGAPHAVLTDLVLAVHGGEERSPRCERRARQDQR